MFHIAESVRAVSPFMDRMSAAVQEDFLDDYVACVRKMQLAMPHAQNARDTQFRSPYKLMVAYARK